MKSGVLPAMGLGTVYLNNSNAHIIDYAISKGIKYFDTAQCYTNGESEIALGNKIKKHNRKEIILSSKCGVTFTQQGIQLNGSKENIKACCDISLARLQTDYIDIYYLHRVDPKIPIEESMQAFKELVNENKIKYIGLSEVTANQIRRAHAIHPIAAVQIEYAPWSRQDEFNAVIATCQELDIQIVAYSPLGRSFFTNLKPEHFESLPETDFLKLLPRYNGENLIHNLMQRSHIDDLAKKKNCTTAQLVLAWILSKGFTIIPGTNNSEHFDENIKALTISFTEEELNEIQTIIDKISIKGERYPNQQFSAIYPDDKDDTTFSNFCSPSAATIIAKQQGIFASKDSLALTLQPASSTSSSSFTKTN